MKTTNTEVRTFEHSKYEHSNKGCSVRHSIVRLFKCSVVRLMYFLIPICLIPYTFPLPCSAQLQVTPNNSAAILAQTLAGNGVTVSGATMNCPSGAAGTFVGTASNIGIAGGTLLTTGSVNIAVGPNFSPDDGIDKGVIFNDPDILAIEPLAVYDVCILEFNAVPTCSTMSFTFAFGSDEYPEFVNEGYNDAFGIFVTGPNPSGGNYTGYNMARIPVSLVPVSINNVNNGGGGALINPCCCPTPGPCTNCVYYIDNCALNQGTVEYDGFTKPITVTLNVVPCGNYRLKLAVADAGDGVYDSGVFFVQQSLVCNSSLTLNTTTTPAACASNNGTATVNVTGGASPYTYTWNTTPAQNTQTATGLAPGTYTVTVVDADGCLTGTKTVTITNIGGFTVTPIQSNTTCGNNNGSASVTISGGTAPYTYAWSTNPVQTASSISNIPAGNYTVSVTDATGCVQTQTFAITQPNVITANITNSVNASCFGANDGSAAASASGGTGALVYTWNTSPAQTGTTASNLIAGNYMVTITDASGCTTTQSVTITSPPQIILTTSITPSACGMKTGAAAVNVLGASPPYIYQWSTSPVQTTPAITGLSGGNYTVVVTDNSGCSQSQTVVVPVNNPPAANFYFSPAVISLLDPFVTFTDASAGNLTVWSWNFGDTVSGTNNTSTLQNPTHVYSDTGTYCITLVITDAGGACMDSVVKCLKVEEPFTFYIPNAFTPNDDNLNESFMGYGAYIKEFNMMIFDRWGNLIFESNDINKGWDGKVKNKGDIVQEDIYVWKVKLIDTKNTEHKYIGRVTVAK